MAKLTMHNRRKAFLSGAKTIAPILLGVIPFALIAAVIAWRTKNVLWTISAGMASLWLSSLL
ncbi:MAG: hypothetical protein WAM73_06150 [Desulfobacterales bacterium]